MSRKRRRPRRKERRKGVYVLPNLFTSASLYAGFFSIISAINGDYVRAATAILVAGVLDGLDGAVARATKTTSAFGVQYDSLVDLISFGAAPGLMVYLWSLNVFGRIGWAVSFLFLACGALRLARFNVTTSTRDPSFFQGLPIPGAAATIASTVLLFEQIDSSLILPSSAFLGLVLLLALLMVSNLDYISLKNKGLFRSKPFNFLVLTALVFALAAIRPRHFLFFFFITYVASGPIVTVLRRSRNRPKGEETVEEETPAEP